MCKQQQQKKERNEENGVGNSNVACQVAYIGQLMWLRHHSHCTDGKTEARKTQGTSQVYFLQILQHWKQERQERTCLQHIDFLATLSSGRNERLSCGHQQIPWLTCFFLVAQSPSNFLIAIWLLLQLLKG